MRAASTALIRYDLLVVIVAEIVFDNIFKFHVIKVLIVSKHIVQVSFVIKNRTFTEERCIVAEHIIVIFEDLFFQNLVFLFFFSQFRLFTRNLFAVILQLEVLQLFRTGTGRDQMPRDNIFFEALEFIALAQRGGFGQNTGGILEARCRDEAVGFK